MALNNSYWFQDTGLYNSVATQSLRIDSGSNAYLTKTFSSDGDGSGATCTLSFWIKRSKISNTSHWVITAGAGSPAFLFGFNTSDELQMTQDLGNPSYTVTSRKFRDVSSYYHVLLRIDTSESANADKYKIYVNGELQATTISGTVTDSLFGANVVHNIGRYPSDVGVVDGYLSEFNFVDGTALDPTSFGEFKNGVWIAKAYTGSYGTNGFRLEFKQTGVGSGSSSTIGADTSGNDNHFTSNGIVASDCDMPDSPENNFPTLNPLSSIGITYQEGNLEMSGSASNGAISTMGITEGKHYYEVLAFDNGASGNLLVGIIDEDFLETVTTLGTNRGTYRSNGIITNLANSAQTSGSTYATGDFIGVAIDCDNGTVQFYKNNVAQGATPSFTFTAGTRVFAHIRCDNATTIADANFGQDSSFCGNTSVSGNTDADGFEFKYTPPTGFKAICAKNLPEPTISPNASTQADDYFNTVLYTGNGTGQSITGVGFQSDWTWIKRRSATEQHLLTDSVRGVTKGLFSNLSDAEATRTDQIQSFDTDGFTLGNDGAGFTNINTNTYVSWNWKAGGTAVSNTDGTITSSVSANTTAGFSIVTYTGNGTGGATVGHGLGKTPNVFLIKNRTDSGSNWNVYHSGNTSAPETDSIALNTNSAGFDSDTRWNDTLPTSTVFSIGTSNQVNGSSDEFIAYCFAEIEGYSKFGSYTGSSAPVGQGTFVYLGFRPSFVILRDINGGSWGMFDATRNAFNVTNKHLTADTNDAEYSGDTNRDMDFLSNGFKLMNAYPSGLIYDNSARQYIYMAFAEAPFKYANAR